MIDLTSSPDKLRASILQDAMQGKLTKQLPKDGNAEELLKKIQDEKQKLIKENKIKKQKPLPEIQDDEISFDIPENWKWVRLSQIGIWKSGATPKRNHPEYYGGSIPWIKTGDLNDNYINNTTETITTEGLNNSSLNLNPVGSILIAMYCSGAIGKLGILNVEAATNQSCCACIPSKFINNKFLFYYLMSQRFNLVSLASGGAQKNISRQKIINYLFPLPPLSEQQRIVQKLDTLLPQVEAFNKSVEQLHSLRKELPLKLRNSLLQSAMMGKLTKQLPKDGNADELLKQIEDEKQQLVEEKKIKKQKPLPEIQDDEIPFDIPDNWQWTHIGNVFTEGKQKKPDKESLYIDVKSIDNNQNKINNFNEINSKNAPSRARKLAYKNNLIYSTVRPYLHNIAIIDKRQNKELFVSTAFIVMNCLINNEYLKYILLSNFIDIQVNKASTGTTYPAINNNKFKQLIIPVPPLSEQKRIVEKLDKLFSHLKN
jgi:type I restriction enzyme, S subunit